MKRDQFMDAMNDINPEYIHEAAFEVEQKALQGVIRRRKEKKIRVYAGIMSLAACAVIVVAVGRMSSYRLPPASDLEVCEEICEETCGEAAEEITSVVTEAADTTMENVVGEASVVGDTQDQIMTEDASTAEVESVVRPPQKEDFYHAYQQFAFDTLKDAKKKDENIMISPLSLMTALTMAADGADTITRTQMEQVLYQGAHLEVMEPMLLQYIHSLPSTDQVSMQQANSLWINEALQTECRRDYLDHMTDAYESAIFQKVFDTKTCDEINQWVDVHTEHRITNVLDKLDADSIMVLINAISFEGKWEQEYDASDISEHELFTEQSGVTEDVKMLYSTEYGYYEDEDVMGFRKAYRDGYSFVAMLPKDPDGLDSYVEQLDSEKWEALMDTYDASQEVRVKIPCFRSEYQCDMSNVLKQNGMVDAFDDVNADFSRMVNLVPGENVFLDQVIHKTFIDLDEEGTKAAAVTAITMDLCTSVGPSKEVIQYIYLDRPFVYAIVDDESGLPIFLGVMEKVVE